MLVIGLVIVAAILHACWNAIVKSVEDRLGAMAVMGASSTLVCLPIALLAVLPRSASIPFLIGSVAVHSIYNLLLIGCYSDGDFNQVYPIARGISPPTVAVFAVVVVGERLGVLQVIGLAVLTGGLLAVALGRGAGSRRGVMFAGITGLAIAGYTILDGLGVRRSGSVPGYAGWLFVAEGLIVPIVWALIRSRARGRSRAQTASLDRRQTARCVVAGAVSVLAYGLVLWAQSRGGLAIVAALRETSVVFGAIIGARVFHDGMSRRRVLASVLIASGAVLLAAA